MKSKKFAELPERSHPDYGRLYRELNKERLQEKQKLKYQKDRERILEQRRATYDPEKTAKYRNDNRKKYREHNWKKQGIIDFTHEMYLEELQHQNKCCKICGTIMKVPQVDHDHKTGKYRGLLCKPCNFGLGVYEKNKDQFEQYLIEHGMK